MIVHPFFTKREVTPGYFASPAILSFLGESMDEKITPILAPPTGLLPFYKERPVFRTGHQCPEGFPRGGFYSGFGWVNSRRYPGQCWIGQGSAMRSLSRQLHTARQVLHKQAGKLRSGQCFRVISLLPPPLSHRRGCIGVPFAHTPGTTELGRSALFGP